MKISQWERQYSQILRSNFIALKIKSFHRRDLSENIGFHLY